MDATLGALRGAWSHCCSRGVLLYRQHHHCREKLLGVFLDELFRALVLRRVAAFASPRLVAPHQEAPLQLHPGRANAVKLAILNKPTLACGVARAAVPQS